MPLILQLSMKYGIFSPKSRNGFSWTSRGVPVIHTASVGEKAIHFYIYWLNDGHGLGIAISRRSHVSEDRPIIMFVSEVFWCQVSSKSNLMARVLTAVTNTLDFWRFCGVQKDSTVVKRHLSWPIGHRALFLERGGGEISQNSQN